MIEQRERQERQIGVRLPNGTVKLFPHRHAAEDHAHNVNAGLQLSGLPDRAVVVSRYARHVTTTYGDPWEVTK